MLAEQFFHRFTDRQGTLVVFCRIRPMIIRCQVWQVDSGRVERAEPTGQERDTALKAGMAVVFEPRTERSGLIVERAFARRCVAQESVPLDR